MNGTDSWLNGFVTLETLASHPEGCLQRAPVAVLDGEKKLGYLIDPASFEALMAMAVAYEQQHTVEGRFRLSGDELRSIARSGTQLLSEASEAKLAEFGQFHEVDFSNTSDDGAP